MTKSLTERNAYTHETTGLTMKPEARLTFRLGKDTSVRIANADSMPRRSIVSTCGAVAIFTLLNGRFSQQPELSRPLRPFPDR